MLRHVFFVGFLLAGSSRIAASAQVDLDENQIVTQAVTGEHDCAKGDWQFALLAESSGLLKSEALPTLTCRAVSLAWLPSAQIVQVTGWQHTDVFVSLTIVRATAAGPLRLITKLGGLVVPKHWENDEGNKPAFNELLTVSGYEPTDAQMLELGELYLFMVGHPPDESPKKLRDVLVVNDVTGWVVKKGRWTTVTVHQRTSPPFGSAQREWTLKFHAEKARLRLVSVEPERHSA